MVVRPTLKWGEGPNLSNIILVVVIYYLKLSGSLKKNRNKSIEGLDEKEIFLSNCFVCDTSYDLLDANRRHTSIKFS